MSFPTDPIGNVKPQWYSAAINPADSDEGLYDYCTYCLSNFKRFYPLVNHVCQSCGKAAEPVTKDKQEHLKISSINKPMDGESGKGVSIDFDYSPLSRDPTLGNGVTGSTVMTANSIGEAVRKLRIAEYSGTKAAAAALRNEKYIIKTTATKDQNKVLFDNNL